MNVASLLENNVRMYGEYVTLVYEDREYTNVEILTMANRFGNALLNLGLQRGDRVLVMLANCPEILVVCPGTMKIGAVIVPVLFMLESGETEYILNNSRAKIVVVGEEFFYKFEPILERCPSVEHAIVVGDKQIPNTLRFGSLVADSSPELSTVEAEDDEVAMILYTAGTTGKPKGVMLTHANLVSNAYAAAQTKKLSFLMALPLSHSYGITAMNAAYVRGQGTVLLKWFSPAETLKSIEKYRLTRMSAVPTMFNYLLNFPGAEDYDTSSMWEWTSGAAPLPVELIEAFQNKFGGTILEGYGLTETSPVVSAHRLGMKTKPGSVGKPVEDVQVRIVDDDGNELARGEVGEIAVRGPNVMKGYFENPEATAFTVKDGWLHTGDMGYIDEDGYLFIVDRKKEMIIRGGFNVYPREVEEVLYAHPAVIEAGVIGIPDDMLGEEVKAFVALKEGQTTTEEELIQHCEANLAQFKCPKIVEFLPALPKSLVGKVLRKELRDIEERRRERTRADRPV